MYPISKPIQTLNQASYSNTDRDKVYKDDWKFTTIVALIAGLILGARIGHTTYMYSPDGYTFAGLTWDVIENDLLTHPFALFPTAWQWVLTSLLLPLVVWINGYEEYMCKRNTMWKNAHGSGGFEKNYAGFYREYLYDPALIGGPTTKNVENKTISKKEDLIVGASLYDKFLYSIKSKQPGAKNRLITKADLAKCKLNAQAL